MRFESHFRWVGRFATLPLLIALVFIPIATGGRHAEVKAEPPNEAVKTKEPDRSTKKIIPPAEPASPTTNMSADDLNTRAQLAERRVVDAGKEVNLLLAEIHKHAQEMKPGDLVKEKMAIDAFRTLLPKLKTEARWLLDRRIEMDANGQRYAEALERAQQAFLDLVPVWKKFSADESEPGLREHYTATSKSFEGLSAEMGRRRILFQAGASGIHKQLLFVERSHVFLERLEKVVPILDNPATAGAEMQAYLTQVRQYVQSFENAMKAFKELSDKMQSPPPQATSPAGDNR